MRVHPRYIKYVKWLLPSAGAVGAIGVGRHVYRRSHPSLPALSNPSPRNCPGTGMTHPPSPPTSKSSSK